MKKINFSDLSKKYRENSEKIKLIESKNINYKELIENTKKSFEAVIEGKKQNIEFIDKAISAIHPDKMADFEKESKVYMEKIAKEEREIATLEKKRDREVKSLEKEASQREELAKENKEIIVKAKERKEALLKDVEKEYQKNLKESQKKETDEVKKAREELKGFEKQLADIEQDEKDYPNKVKDARYKKFLQDKVKGIKKFIDDNTGEKAADEIRQYQINEINEEYLIFKKAIAKEYMPEEFRGKNPVLEEAKEARRKKEEEKLKNAVKGEPLSEDLFKEAREDGDLPPRSSKVVPKDNRIFTPEQKEAWKGSRLNTEELMKDRQNTKVDINFDIATGKYIYRDNKGNKKALKIVDENGEEVFNEAMKKRIRDELVKQGVGEKEASKSDPYIYSILKRMNPEKMSEYVDALKDISKDIENLDIRYNLKTKENGKKRVKTVDLNFAQRRNIRKRANWMKKEGLASVLKDKSRAKIYGILAALGLSSAAGLGVKLLEDNNKKENVMEYYDETNGTTDPAIIINPEPTTTPTQKQKQTPTSTPIPITNEKDEYKTEYTQLDKDEIDEKDVKVGGYVTIDLGAHLYRDPFDAIKEKLQQEPNEKVVVKSKNGDKVYKVTRQGIYCEDGRRMEGSNEEIEAILKGQEISYEKMIHIESEGIAEWVKEDDVGEVLEFDKMGNRISKTKVEKRTEEAQRADNVNQKEVAKDDLSK